MFDGKKNIFMVGIEGAGMRALAYLLTCKGLVVTGSDFSVAQEKTIEGYTVLPEEEAAARFEGTEVLIYSDAVPSNHPLRQLSQEKHILSLPYQEALGEFARDFEVLAVTGTHGKSSTTAMLSHILVEAGVDPTVIVGASIPAWEGRNARSGKSNYLVVEADEYRRHFLALRPKHLIITSVDFDHPDYFSSLQDVEQAYSEFISQLQAGGSVVTPRAVQIAHPNISWPKNTELIEEVSEKKLELVLPGKHMQQNARLAIALGALLGVDHEAAILALKNFQGLKRRMEQLGTMGNATIFSDYGHHPEEIATTLTGIRDTYPGKKIAVLVEPHMPERLETFFDGFVNALEGADVVILCPVFYPKGREGSSATKLSSLETALTAKNVDVRMLPDYEHLSETLRTLSSSVDIIVAFTAGVLDGKLRAAL